MSLNRVKKLKILKLDSNNNVSVFKANKKIFKSIFTFSKYTKILRFGPDCLILQINTIEHCKLFVLYLFSVYIKIAQKFINYEL